MNPLNLDKVFRPRGQKVALYDGSLPENISPYLLDLIARTGGNAGPLGKQFIANPALEQKNYSKVASDPLIEEKNEVAPGVIYKYKGKLDQNGKALHYGRALWTITRFCATYCRFCTRGRVVGLPMASGQVPGKKTYAITNETIAQRPYLSSEDIQKAVTFFKSHRELNEVILSGGDPLVVPEKYFATILEELCQLQQTGDLDFIRLHTRAPITNPFVIQEWHYKNLEKIHNPFIVLHINHPAELTPEVLKIVDRLNAIKGMTLLSQSVLLKGVNDNSQTLCDLFLAITKAGIRPYYLHQNDPVYWAKHFTVPIQKAIKLWQSLRPRLSGIVGSAKFVIDTPYGYGKVPIPEGGWEVTYDHFYDFHQKEHSL